MIRSLQTRSVRPLSVLASFRTHAPFVSDQMMKRLAQVSFVVLLWFLGVFLFFFFVFVVWGFGFFFFFCFFCLVGFFPGLVPAASTPRFLVIARGPFLSLLHRAALMTFCTSFLALHPLSRRSTPLTPAAFSSNCLNVHRRPFSRGPQTGVLPHSSATPRGFG